MINHSIQAVDVIIIGAGAAGLMCAIEAGKRGRRVIVLEQANKPGKKILMSGGGRCNFTNYHIQSDKYISHNPHFCKSALSRYTQWDFIELVKRHRISFNEKTLGQLFCDEKSQAILNMLLLECEAYGVEIKLNTNIKLISKQTDQSFLISSDEGKLKAQSLVIATGGLSIPTMGSSPFGYEIAKQFGIKVWPTRAGLVPLTLVEKQKATLSALSGVSVDALISVEKINFRENMLFTHRGLSGPAILQISSYWQQGELININMLPTTNLYNELRLAKQHSANKQLKSVLTTLLPKSVVEIFVAETELSKKLATFSKVALEGIAKVFNKWSLIPNGTEGYRTAEVTLGGVDCDAVSSKTMEALKVQGLYFIGEVLDVTGWLGGYNFQWAWSSGFAAGQVV